MMNFYRAMLRRAWLWDCMSSVCPWLEVCFFTVVGIHRK